MAAPTKCFPQGGAACRGERPAFENVPGWFAGGQVRRRGLVGVAALSALAQHARAILPVWGDGEGDLLVEGPLLAWAALWGCSLMLVAGAWSGVLAYLQWGR